MTIIKNRKVRQNAGGLPGSVCFGLSDSLAHPENTLEQIQLKAVRTTANLQGENGASCNCELGRWHSVLVKGGLAPRPHPGARAPLTPRFLGTTLLQRVAG